MRRDHHVRQRQHLTVGVRLGRKDVQAGARRPCPTSRPRTSASISTSSPRAALTMRTPGRISGNRCVVDDVAGLGRERGVQRDEVRLLPQLLEAHRQSPGAPGTAPPSRTGRARSPSSPDREHETTPAGRFARSRRCRASCRPARLRRTAIAPTAPRSARRAPGGCSAPPPAAAPARARRPTPCSRRARWQR